MILTGKAKDYFEMWVNNTHDDNGNGQTGKRLFYIESIDDYKFINTEHYIHNIGESMLYALIIEWFDSVGIYIEITKDRYITEQWINNVERFPLYKTRQEATNQAIIKANQIYNESKN